MVGIEFPVLGRHNTRLKDIRRMDTPCGRDSLGCFVVEGLRVVNELLNSSLELQALYCAVDTYSEAYDLALKAQQRGAEVFQVDISVLESVAPTHSSQGLLGVAKLPQYSVEQVLAGDSVVVLQGVQDPGNVGTLMRSASAFGATGVLLLGGADPFSSRAVRSSVGAAFRLPVLRLGDEESETALALLREHSLDIVTAVAHGGVSLTEVRFPKRMALVLGGEVSGVSQCMQDAAAVNVSIPLEPNCESLNVAAAGAVMLYQAKCSSRGRGLAGVG